MEITNKDDRKIVNDIIQHYQIEEPLCLQSICKEYNKAVINGVIDRKYSLVIKEKTEDQYKSTFYKLIQVCSFVYELFNKRYIFADISVKNKNPNDYTNDGYPYFSFNENGGDFQLGKFIADFWTIPLIPTSQLIHLKENRFTSTEERRYKGQLKASYFATFVALVIGVSSPLLMSKCSNTKINDKQFEEIIRLINDNKVDTLNKDNNNSTSQYNWRITNEKPCRSGRECGLDGQLSLIASKECCNSY